MFSKILLSFLTGTICTITLFSQEKVFKHFTTEDGLSHDITYEIIQDTKGFIWIGTDDGLAKFDGKRFQTYSYEKGLRSNYVIDVLEEKTNEFLVATWGEGLHVLRNDSIYKIKKESFNYGKLKKIYKINDSLIYGFSNNWFSVYNKENESSVKRIKKHKGLNQYYISENVYDYDNEIVEFNQDYIDGSIYFFASEVKKINKEEVKGIHVLEDESLTSLSEFENIYVHAIAKKNKTFLVGSHNSLCFFQKKKAIEKRRVLQEKGKIIKIDWLSENEVFFVFLSEEDGTRKLYKYDWEAKEIVDISKELGIKSFVSDFMHDIEGNLWITTYGQGVYFLPRIYGAFFGDNFFSNSDLKDVTLLENRLLILASNRVYEIHNNAIESETTLPFKVEFFYLNKNERLVNVVTRKTNDFKITKRRFQLKNTEGIVKVFEIGNLVVKVQNFWFSVYNKKTKEYIKKDITPLKSYSIKKVLKKEDKIFVLYKKQGVYEIDISSLKVKKWGKEVGVGVSQYNDILFGNNGSVFLATNKGLLTLVNGKEQQFTTQHGLLSNHINSLYIDSHNVLWLATQKGLNVFKNNQIYTVDKNLGQKSTFITKVLEHKNNIYATGNNGLFKMNNQQPFTSSLHTKLIINQQENTFFLDKINYINPLSVKVQYKLNEEDWKTLEFNELSFDNSKAGLYNIVFRYKDNASDWRYSEEYKFDITVPWFNNLWFYVVVVMNIAGILILIIYNQLIKARKKNKIFQRTIQEREKLQEDLKNVRHQIAQDFHDDLGNKLASISMLSNLSLKKTEKESNLYPNLNQINKDANFLYAGMRDFVWSLDYKNNKLREVQMYLNDFGEKLFEYSGINFKSTNNVAKSEVTLPHYWNKQLVLVFKEAMTNTLKHSKATEVQFSVFLNEHDLEIKLEDNGVGFDINTKGRQNGLRNMKERIKSINGELYLQTVNGFSVCFKGNINQ